MTGEPDPRFAEIRDLLASDPFGRAKALAIARAAAGGKRSIPERLAAARDALGWRPPYHEHWKISLPKSGPPTIVNCSAPECEAPGCPRTESGFPGAVPDAPPLGLVEAAKDAFTRTREDTDE